MDRGLLDRREDDQRVGVDFLGEPFRRKVLVDDGCRALQVIALCPEDRDTAASAGSRNISPKARADDSSFSSALRLFSLRMLFLLMV